MVAAPLSAGADSILLAASRPTLFSASSARPQRRTRRSTVDFKAYAFFANSEELRSALRLVVPQSNVRAYSMLPQACTYASVHHCINASMPQCLNGLMDEEKRWGCDGQTHRRHFSSKLFACTRRQTAHSWPPKLTLAQFRQRRGI